MKATPETVTFVYESFTVPKVALKDASQRVLNPAPEEPLKGWPQIHENIRNLRRDQE